MKGWVEKKVRQIEFDTGDNDSREYKVEVIWDSAVYSRESKSGHLSGFYYLVLWKGYPEEKNIWEPVLAVQHFRKLISLFHKNHLDQPTATFPTIDIAPLIARPIVKPTVKPTKPPKQKREQPTNSIHKQTKKNRAAFDFYCIFGQISITPDSTSSAALHVTSS